MRTSLLTLLLLLSITGHAQYTSWLTGDAFDVTTSTTPGTCLMGGASENEAAMIWLMEKAGGGDVVVLRSSGSDGYNDFLYTDLGLTLNSVETILIPNATAAADPYVVQQIQNAEAIWIAGGDQFDYVSLWKDGPIEDALNAHINIKKAPFGGTSAGMAVLGMNYFSAENGTVTSAQALADPYHNNVTVGHNDFLFNRQLNRVITDTHYDDPDRKGRHAVFLARTAADHFARSRGIAAEEYTAICIDSTGRAFVYGEYPTYNDFAYFLQVSCETEFLPEGLSSGSPLHWDRDGKAIYVYVVPGTPDGSNWFDIAGWRKGAGGLWENWSVLSGVMQYAPGVAPECETIKGLSSRPLQSTDKLIIRE